MLAVRSWTCTSRPITASYFIELMLLLERMYGLIGQNGPIGSSNKILNPHLKKAVIYIENNYRQAITLEDVVKAASLNHSTLTQLFKNELDMTPIEYVWYHRLIVAKKFIAICEFNTKIHITYSFLIILLS